MAWHTEDTCCPWARVGVRGSHFTAPATPLRSHTIRACEVPERCLFSGLPCSGRAWRPLATWNTSKACTILVVLSSSSLAAWRVQLEAEEADARGEKTHWWKLSFTTPSYLPSLLPDSSQLVPLLVLQVFLNIQIGLTQNVFNIYSEHPSFLADMDLLTRIKTLDFFKLFSW